MNSAHSVRLQLDVLLSYIADHFPDDPHATARFRRRVEQAVEVMRKVEQVVVAKFMTLVTNISLLR